MSEANDVVAMNPPPEEPYTYPASRKGHPVAAPVTINYGRLMAVMVALLVAAIIGWINLSPRTHKLQTKSVMKGIEIALKGYQSEYNRCLLVEMQLPGDQNLVFEGAILSALMAESTKYNPRKVRFFDLLLGEKGAVHGGMNLGLGNIATIWAIRS